ncbi:MAG: phage tail sheath subtilisin-like domain-containing protein [Clostridium sp.]|nr:phage tail sheath subtilisin-like domain-containing protein [Clostridium sp.]
MSVTTHERPGVYSAYDVSSVVSGSDGSKVVGLAAVNASAEIGAAYTITTYDQAVSTFGAGENMTELIRVVLLNGAAGVIAVPVEAGEYDDAFALLGSMEEIAVMLCDSTDVTVQQALRDTVQAASAARRERIAVVGCAAGETVAQLVTRAQALNDERVVLIAPGGLDLEENEISGVLQAGAAAGAIAGMADPAIPLGGAELAGLTGLSSQYSDNDIDLLVRGGVTALESVAGVISVVRGVTTRTTTGGESDRTWRELSTILIVDNVIPAIRASLRSKFRRAKNTVQGRGAIRAQVVLELENKRSREIISGYDNVTVTADSEDPTRCLVEFSFTVAHGLNQIWLTAHIAV